MDTTRSRAGTSSGDYVATIIADQVLWLDNVMEERFNQMEKNEKRSYKVSVTPALHNVKRAAAVLNDVAWRELAFGGVECRCPAFRAAAKSMLADFQRAVYDAEHDLVDRDPSVEGGAKREPTETEQEDAIEYVWEEWLHKLYAAACLVATDQEWWAGHPIHQKGYGLNALAEPEQQAA